jgi:hypothetical protein
MKVAYFQPIIVAAGPVPPADFVKIYNLTEAVHAQTLAQEVQLYPNETGVDYSWLVSLIEEMCKGYMDLVSTQSVTQDLEYCEPKVVNIRTVRQVSGDYMEMHTHPAGNLSGHIYASVPDYGADKKSNDGMLVLRLPQTRDLTRFIMQDNWKFQPEPGTFVLFPSHIPHGVNPWHGQGSRTVLAFDVVLAVKDIANGQS